MAGGGAAQGDRTRKPKSAAHNIAIRRLWE